MHYIKVSKIKSEDTFCENQLNKMTIYIDVCVCAHIN